MKICEMQSSNVRIACRLIKAFILSQGQRATCSCRGEQPFTRSQRWDHTSRCRSEFTCPHRAREPLYLPHHDTVLVLLHEKWRGRDGGHGSQKNSPTPTWSQRFFFYCIVIFFSHQDSPTTINNIDWFLSLAHECDLWKRKESCWDSSAKMLKFCLGSDLCAFLMFHPCLTLVLLSWKTSERLHSFPDFDRHRR